VAIEIVKIGQVFPELWSEWSLWQTGKELPGESSVYKYTLEYVTTHLPEEFSKNRMRLLEE